MHETGEVIGPPAFTPSFDGYADAPPAIGSIRCSPNGSPYWLMPPRLKVAIAPSFTPCARYAYLGDAASILFSASMVAFDTTQIVSTVAEPTGAGNCAVHIR